MFKNPSSYPEFVMFFDVQSYQTHRTNTLTSLKTVTTIHSTTSCLLDQVLILIDLQFHPFMLVGSFLWLSLDQL